MACPSARKPNAPDQEPPALLTEMVKLDEVAFCGGLNSCLQVYKAKNRRSGKACAAFVYAKNPSKRSGKSRSKDVNAELCRREVENLRTFKNKHILHLYSDVIETDLYVCWITEPLEGSLQSILHASVSGEFPATELEIILGIFQITDALRYLHGTQNTMHCNICPSTIFVTACSQWKLGGLNFLEHISDNSKSQYTGFNPKSSSTLQPDLDYIAPEVQMHGTMSPPADIFSFGLVICALYNGGNSLIQSDGNVTKYLKQLTKMDLHFRNMCGRLPKALVEPVRKMISQDIRERPTAQLLALLKLFNEPTLLSYEGLLTLPQRSTNQKKDFFNRFSKAIPEFNPSFRYSKVLPLLWTWYDQNADLRSFVLPSILTIVHIAEKGEYDAYLHDRLIAILKQEKSKQTSLVALDLVQFYIKYLSAAEVIEIVLQDVAFCCNIKTQKSMEVIRNAVHVLREYLGSDDLECHLFPLLKSTMEGNQSSILVQVAMLDCIECLLPHLRQTFINKEVLPALADFKSSEPEVIVGVAAVFRRVICDAQFHVPHSLTATKLLPPLIPHLVSDKLNILEFRAIIGVVRLMLEHIDQGRTTEYRRKNSCSAEGSIVDLNSGSQTPYFRNLPLISMQKPSVDFSISPPNANARPRSHSSDSNGFSVGHQSGTPPWSSSRQFLNRLRASSQTSETMLGKISSSLALRPIDKTHSNPNFGQRLSLNCLPKTSRAASWNSNTAAFAALERRRSSGGFTARLSQEHLGSLSVNEGRSGYLDPRRHSYGCSATSSANSLLTGSVCEGPFPSPLQSKVVSRRPSVHMTDRDGNGAKDSSGTSPRTDENIFFRIATNLFARRI